MRIVLQAAVDRFNGIGCFQTHSQVIKNPQPMEREGFLKTLIEAVDGRLVEQTQFLADGHERLLCRFIAVLLIGFLEFFAKFSLLRLGQIGSHVFPLVPLASLDQGLLAKHLLNPFAQSPWRRR